MKSGSREFYVKKIYLILTDAKRLFPFMDLVKSLQDNRIACEALLEDEEIPIEQDVLYITDSAGVLADLAKQGLPVAAYLHEENREQDLSAAKYAFEQPENLDEEYVEKVYRRYKGIAWDILETERCYLRETTVEDVDAFYNIYKNPEITRYTENLYESRVSECAYIKEYIDKVYRFYEFGIWTVILKETGEIIGRAGLSVREGYDLPEIGYVIGIPWQGKGIAKEICSAILKYGRREYGFEQFQALIQKENEPSIKLAEGLGFQVQELILQDDKEYFLLIKC